MAYTRESRTNPAGSQTGSAFATSALANDNALQDQVLSGLGDGWTYSQSGGTAEEPTTILLTNTTNSSIVFKATLTWSGGNITGATYALSTAGSGGPFDTIGSAATFTYDGSGNLTATTNFGGLFAKLAMELLGKYKATRTAYNAHAAATGASVHGLSTMSTQSAAAVAITGGTINGATVGATTAAAGTFTAAAEKSVAATFGATTTLPWNDRAAASSTATGSGAATLAFSNLPASGNLRSLTWFVVNGGLRTWSYPASVVWVSGSAPSLRSSGSNVISFFTVDGGTTVYGSVVY